MCKTKTKDYLPCICYKSTMYTSLTVTVALYSWNLQVWYFYSYSKNSQSEHCIQYIKCLIGWFWSPSKQPIRTLYLIYNMFWLDSFGVPEQSFYAEFYFYKIMLQINNWIEKYIIRQNIHKTCEIQNVYKIIGEILVYWIIFILGHVVQVMCM